MTLYSSPTPISTQRSTPSKSRTNKLVNKSSLSGTSRSTRYFAEDQEWLQQVEHYVQQNIKNSQFTIAQLAHAVAVSERQLRRRLKSLIGMRPWQYVQVIRLERARQLLQQRKYKTVSRLAAEVGYRNADSFNDVFRQYFGVLPKEYLQLLTTV